MPGRYVVDSNVAIAILNGQLDLQARRQQEGQVFLCPAVVEELAYGALKSQRVEANLSRLGRLLEICPVLPATAETARHCAELRMQLRRKGQPIPEHDLWIAAAALHYSLVVATRDHHFDDLEGIEVEAW